jgi:hypothetical protein
MSKDRPRRDPVEQGLSKLIIAMPLLALRMLSLLLLAARRFSVRRVPVWLFKPLERATLALTHTARRLQSGSLNLYLGVIGVILVLILATILF